MRHLRIVFPFLLLALLAACRTATDVERDYAQTLAPHELDAPVADAAPVKVLKLRVYVDEQYQAHVLGWPDKVRAQIERVNAVLAPSFHVRFVSELRSWHRASDDPRLEVALDELHKTDPGTDCDWVLGLTGVLALATPDLHHIGMADLFSRHMVMHAMDDAAEGEAISKSFTHISEEEKFALYRDRKRHKETVVLLHEWAHTLGAVHSRITSDLLYPSYDNTQAAFGPPNAEIIQANLAARLQGQAPDSAQAKAVVRTALERDGCPACDPSDREKVLAMLDGHGPPASQTTVAAAPAEPAQPVPAPGNEELRRAAELLDHHDLTGAWAIARPFATAHPDQKLAQRVACVVAVATPKGPDGRRFCARWAELEPDSMDAQVDVAWAHDQQGDRAQAAQALALAVERLPLASKVEPEVWTGAAKLAQNLVMLSVVDASLAHLSDAGLVETLERWSLQNRRRLGLPADAQRFHVAPAEEPEYAQAIHDVSAHLQRNEFGPAQRLLARDLSRWPDAPGLLAARCQLEEGRGQLAQARADCERALRGDDEAVWAHFDLALMAMDARDLGSAASHLQRVIALDPSIRSAWRNLIQVRLAQHEQPAADALTRDYQKRFNALP